MMKRCPNCPNGFLVLEKIALSDKKQEVEELRVKKQYRCDTCKALVS